MSEKRNPVRYNRYSLSPARWDLYFWPTTVQVVYVPELNSLKPPGEFPLDHGPMLGLLLGEDVMRPIGVGFRHQQWNTQVAVERNAERL